MKKAILVLAVLAASVTTAEASTTVIHATPANPVAGEAVTFTATFTSSCPGALTTHYFTIDGKVYSGKLTQTGQAGSETLLMAALAVGTHSVRYDWKIATTICRGFATMSLPVAPVPSPSPSPSPPPSPAPSPTPSAVTLVANNPTDRPFLGYLGGALIVIVVLAGAALMVLGRR